MYFLTSVGLAIVSLLLWILIKKARNLHFEILALIYASSSIMWLVDCIASSIEGEKFLSFEIPTDIYISIGTLIGGLFLWGIIDMIIYFISKKKLAE